MEPGAVQFGGIRRYNGEVRPARIDDASGLWKDLENPSSVKPCGYPYISWVMH